MQELKRNSYIYIAIYTVILIILSFIFIPKYFLQKAYNPYIIENNYTLNYLPCILFFLCFLIIIKLIFIKNKKSFPLTRLVVLTFVASFVMAIPVRNAGIALYTDEELSIVPSVYMPSQRLSVRDKKNHGFIIKVFGDDFSPKWPSWHGIRFYFYTSKKPEHVFYKKKSDLWSEVIPDAIKREETKKLIYSSMGKDEIYSGVLGGRYFLVENKLKNIAKCQKSINQCVIYFGKEDIVYIVYIENISSISDIQNIFNRRENIVSLMESFSLKDL